MPDDLPPSGLYRVRIRRAEGWHVKPAAEELDGRVLNLTYGFALNAEEHGERYAGEHAMYLSREDARPDLPIWIASGDLEAL